MAMWAPRLWTRAPTVLKDAHVCVAQTLNALRLPTVGGPAATTSGVGAARGRTSWAGGAGGAPYARLAPPRLREPSKDNAGGGFYGGAPAGGGALAQGAPGRPETGPAGEGGGAPRGTPART